MKKLIEFESPMVSAMASFSRQSGMSVSSVVEQAVYEFLKGKQGPHLKDIEAYELASYSKTDLTPHSSRFNPVRYKLLD